MSAHRLPFSTLSAVVAVVLGVVRVVVLVVVVVVVVDADEHGTEGRAFAPARTHCRGTQAAGQRSSVGETDHWQYACAVCSGVTTETLCSHHMRVAGKLSVQTFDEPKDGRDASIYAAFLHMGVTSQRVANQQAVSGVNQDG